MSKSKLAPVLRGPVRLVVGILALVTGLFHLSGAGAPAGASGAAVPPAPVPQENCGGDGGDGGDSGTCDYTHMNSDFCPCTMEPCFGGGDTGGDCYYGWSYFHGCGGGPG